MRYADGRVAGQNEYQQSALGESFRFHRTVTCIGAYAGNRAKFGGPITRSDDPTIPVGVFMWFTVVDNGQGAASAPDRSAFSASATMPRTKRSVPVTRRPIHGSPPISTSGNIRVRDGGA